MPSLSLKKLELSGALLVSGTKSAVAEFLFIYLLK